MAKRYTVEVVITGKDQATPALSGVRNMLAGVAQVAGGMLLARGLEAVTSRIMDIGREGIMAAARVDELNLVLQLVGQRSGKSASEIDSLVEKMKDLGIRTDVAQNLLTQFSRYQLDVADAAKLARVAQDAAVIAMEDSSQTLQGLLYGIMTYNTEVLRTRGITVNMAQAFATFARENNIAVDAMTSSQKAQAALNAVLKEGEGIAGTYETAMESAGKQLRSLPRHIYELSVSIGKPFQAAFADVIATITHVVKAFRWAVDEGGPLHDTLNAIGAVASLATTALRNLVDQGIFMLKALADEGVVLSGVMGADVPRGVQKAEEAFAQAMPNTLSSVVNTVQGIAGRFIQLAEDALVWGVNVSTEFATGLIEGAANAIVAAMNFIGGLLSSWLAPGSPPKVAPQLPQWGAEAFTTYLKGFTQADFGVLSALQAPLQSALSTLADLGDMAAKDVGPLFAALSQRIAQALADFQKTGQVDEKLFNQLTRAGGRFGEQLSDLARKQFALAAGVKAVEEAEQKLNAARRAQESAQRTVSSLVDEYNALLKAGASEAVLKAKREELQVAHDQLLGARQAEKLAEKQRTDAEDQARNLYDQVQLQEQLVRQLIEMTKAAEESAKAIGKVARAGRKGRGGKLGDLVPKVPELKFPKPDLSSVNEAFDELKNKIKKKLEEMFGPALAKWKELSESPVWKQLEDSFGNLAKKWDEFYNTYIKPVVDNIIAKLPEAGNVIEKALGAAGKVFTDETWPKLQKAFETLTTALAKLGIDWDTIFKGIEFLVTGVIGVTVMQITTLIGIFTGLVNGVATAVEFISQHLTTLVAGFELMRVGITNIIQGFVNIISGMLTGNMELWNQGFNQFTTGILELITGFVVSMLGWIEVMVAGITGFISGLVTGVIGFFQNLFDALIGGSIIPDLVTGILNAIGGLATDFVTAIGTMIADAQKKFNVAEWVKLGKDMIQGMIDGIGKMGALLGKAIVDIVNEAIAFFKEMFGIASPARKKFPDLGANMAAGVQMGWAKQFGAGLQLPGVAGGTGAMPGGSYTAGGRHDHWNLTIQSNAQTEDVAADFALMRTLSGAR